jgi:ubiquinone/menaquinone biosynthesis C-methylase UbiE
MKFKNDFFARYLNVAPLPLAIERTWECEIQSDQDFQRPILDIGCGEGIFAWGLMDENIDVGIEPNGRELERASDLDLYDELIECYGDNIPKPDQSFQTIFSNSVLEHISEIEPVLKEAHRLLKDGGTIYLTLPTDNFDHYSWGYQILSNMGLKSLASKYLELFNRFWAHYHFYSSSDWEELFDRCGFKVKDQFEYASKAQCLFNNLVSPLCFFAFVVKKVTNRWFLFPTLRSIVVRYFHLPLFSSFARLSKLPPGKGGLIYFAIEKK